MGNRRPRLDSRNGLGFVRARWLRQERRCMDRMSGEENAWGERAAWRDELTSPVDCNRHRPFPGRSLDVQMREKMEAILPSRSYDMTNTRDGGGRRRGMRRRQVQASRKRATRPWCAILNGRMHRQQRWDLDAARRRRDGRIGVPSRLRVLCTQVRLPAFSQLSGQLPGSAAAGLGISRSSADATPRPQPRLQCSTTAEICPTSRMAALCTAGPKSGL
jgi:hypothetical protein